MLSEWYGERTDSFKKNRLPLLFLNYQTKNYQTNHIYELQFRGKCVLYLTYLVDISKTHGWEVKLYFLLTGKFFRNMHYAKYRCYTQVKFLLILAKSFYKINFPTESIKNCRQLRLGIVFTAQRMKVTFCLWFRWIGQIHIMEL